MKPLPLRYGVCRRRGGGVEKADPAVLEIARASRKPVLECQSPGLRTFSIITTDSMKRSNKLLRLLFGAASVLSAVTLTLGGCTSVDDTLGGNLVPDNQQMRAGFVRFPEAARDKGNTSPRVFSERLGRLVETSRPGYFGSRSSTATLGLRGGIPDADDNLSEIKEGYFGYKPIFDSGATAHLHRLLRQGYADRTAVRGI